MSAPDRDPFALAGADPLIALGAEWDALTARIEAAVDDSDPEADALVLQAIAIEDRIAELVPRSPAGAAVQVRYLRHYLRDLEWGEPAEEIAARLIAGLERLGEEDFEAERWDEARRRYERIIEDHPDSEWIPLAHFRRAMAQFNALVGPEYDLPSMRRARAELRDYLLVRRPERPDFREPAEVALRTVEQWIAKRYEIDADFYRTLGNRPGEAHWLRVLLAEYPDHERAAALRERLAAAEARDAAAATPPSEVKS